MERNDVSDSLAFKSSSTHPQTIFRGKKRQVKFEASHLFKKGLPGRPNKTRRGLLAGGVAAGIMAPVVGGILSRDQTGPKKTLKQDMNRSSFSTTMNTVVLPTFRRSAFRRLPRSLQAPWGPGMPGTHFVLGGDEYDVNIQDASPLTTGRAALVKRRQKK